MNIEKITMKQAKNEYRWMWLAFKAQFPNSRYTHDDIKSMIEGVIAIQKGIMRDESLDD